MKIIYVRSWVALFMCFVVVLATVAFLLYGRIPVTGSGNAIFLTRGKVIPFQSQANGQIGEWFVEVGDQVEKGQLLAVVNQPLINKQLEQAKTQLGETQERNKVVAELSATYTELEHAGLERQRQTLVERIDVLSEEVKKSRELAQSNRDRKEVSLKKNVSNLASLQKLEKARLAELEERLARTQELRRENLQTEDALVQAKQSLSEQQVRIADLERQALEQDNTRVRADDQFLQAINRVIEREDLVVDLKEQLKELDTRRMDIDKTRIESDLNRKLEESELQRRVDQLERQLRDNREIRCETSGVILELTASRGKIISRGQRLGTIDTRVDSDPLEAIVYFKLADGKRIKPGMRLRLTPATVEQERYGSLMAEVASVSSFPVTSEGVGNVVGNKAVAQSLTDGGHQIEVVAELLKDPTSATGYEWNLSNGPEIEITSGTIAKSLVNLEELPPISFVVPILREWEGLEPPSWWGRK